MTEEKRKLQEYLLFTNSLLDSMEQSIKSDSDSNIWRYASYKTYARKYNQLVTEVVQITECSNMLDLFDLEKMKGSCDTIAIEQKNIFDSVQMSLCILKAFIENKIGFKQDKILHIKDFLSANLRKAVFKEPEKEVEIQNNIEQLLIGKGMEKGVDYDREVGRVKVSIKEVVPDFIFPKLGLALEVKLSKSTVKSKILVDEINADIMSYSKEYNSILFLVYDLGSIRDESEFKSDLEANDSISVTIIKH